MRSLPRRARAPVDPAAEARAAALLQAHRGRKPIQPPPAANRFIAPILKPLLANAGVGLAELKRNWAEIVGEQFARTEPEKLARKVLTVRAPSAFATFVQHHESLLLERCRVAGAKVDKIVIRQGAPAPRGPDQAVPLRRPPSAADNAALEAALGGVSSPRLKAALFRLGRAVRSA